VQKRRSFNIDGIDTISFLNCRSPYHHLAIRCILVDVLYDFSALGHPHRGQGGVERLIGHIHVRDPVVVLLGKVIVQDKVYKVTLESNILGAFEDDQIFGRSWSDVSI